jgi:hypothetical protein
MKWEINYNKNDDIVYAKVEGTIDVESEEKLRNEILESMRKNSCRLLLLDLNNAEIGLSTFEIYDIPRKYMAQSVSRNTKMAILYPESQSRDLNFYETVSRNAGYDVMLFPEFEAAMKWLKEKT